MLGGDLGLDAAPRAAVARDHDRALHRNAQPVEHFVVLGDAVVHVHQRRGDVAIDGVGVVAGELLGVLPGGGVGGFGGFGQLGREVRRLHHFERALFGRGEEHVEGLDVRVEAPLLQLRQQPLGVVVIVGRADVMRPGAEPLHVGAHVGGVGNGAELGLPIALAARGRVGIARQGPDVGWKGGGQNQPPAQKTHHEFAHGLGYSTARAYCG